MHAFEFSSVDWPLLAAPDDPVLLGAVAVAYGDAEVAEFVSGVLGGAGTLVGQRTLPGSQEVVRAGIQQPAAVDPGGEGVVVGVSCSLPGVVEAFEGVAQPVDEHLVGIDAQQLVRGAVGDDKVATVGEHTADAFTSDVCVVTGKVHVLSLGSDGDGAVFCLQFFVEPEPDTETSQSEYRDRPDQGQARSQAQRTGCVTGEPEQPGHERSDDEGGAEAEQCACRVHADDPSPWDRYVDGVLSH